MNPPPSRPSAPSDASTHDLLGAGDYFVRWPLGIALGAPLVVGLISAFAPPLVLLAAPLAILVASLAALGALIFAIQHARKRNWRRMVSTIVLPIYV